MPLAPLPPLFHRLDREHFSGCLAELGRPALKLRWSDGRMTRTAGLYRRGPGMRNRLVTAGVGAVAA